MCVVGVFGGGGPGCEIRGEFVGDGGIADGFDLGVLEEEGIVIGIQSSHRKIVSGGEGGGVFVKDVFEEVGETVVVGVGREFTVGVGGFKIGVSPTVVPGLDGGGSGDAEAEVVVAAIFQVGESHGGLEGFLVVVP